MDARVAAAWAMVASAGLAGAQSLVPAVFVANNGNIEGSVTSFSVAPTGALTFVQELVTGSGNTPPANAGNNAYSISITPNGRLLAVSHATAASITEKVSILRVNADATMTLLGQFNTPDSPLDLKWLSNDRIAVTETRSSGQNRVRVYAFVESTLAWTQVDAENTTGFTSSLALHPSGLFLYAPQTPLGGGSSLTTFVIEPDGTLTNIGVLSSGWYPLGPGVTPDGRFLYAAGGISGNSMSGFALGGGSGLPSFLDGSPFATPDSSPKQCVASPDGRFLFVGHGSASTVRSFSIDPDTGALANLGFAFDVGIQGALGDVAVMRLPGRDLLLFTDRDFSQTQGNPRGILSYTINANGSFTTNGPIVDTQGVSPNDIAVWTPAGPTCDGVDFNNDGSSFDPTDIDAFLSVFSEGPCIPAGATCNDIDFNNDGSVFDPCDVDSFLLVFSEGPCTLCGP
jgi:6-phosphogluconolactonase (cycloisomerase 2 family)